MISRLELGIALRYLRSRRSSRLLSLITVIAVGGVTVGVMALVVVLGVMNGLQADLRDKILVANPHLRVLTYGEGLRLDDWHKVLGQVQQTAGVEAAAPFVLTQGLISAGHDYAEGVVVYGVDPDTASRAVTSFAQHFAKGDLTFRTTRRDVEGGIALGTRLASKLSAFPRDVVTLVAPAGAKFNPSVGAYVPKFHRYEVSGIFDTGMYEYDNSYVALDRRVAQRFAGLDTAVTGIEVRLADPWQAQPFGAAALNAAPQECLRGGGDDAEPRTPAGDDRNIDGEFIAPGDELPRAVEGVDQNEAVGDALRQRTARRLLRHDTYAG